MCVYTAYISVLTYLSACCFSTGCEADLSESKDEDVESESHTRSTVTLTQDTQPFRPIVYFTLAPGLILQLPGEQLLSRFGLDSCLE